MMQHRWQDITICTKKHPICQGVQSTSCLSILGACRGALPEQICMKNEATTYHTTIPSWKIITWLKVGIPSKKKSISTPQPLLRVDIRTGSQALDQHKDDRTQPRC